jgi:hypothetical protein
MGFLRLAARAASTPAEGDPAGDLSQAAEHLDNHLQAHRAGDLEATGERGSAADAAAGHSRVAPAGVELDAPTARKRPLVACDLDHRVPLGRRNGDDHSSAGINHERRLHRNRPASAARPEVAATLVPEPVGAQDRNRARDDAITPGGESVAPTRNDLLPALAVDDRRLFGISHRCGRTRELRARGDQGQNGQNDDPEEQPGGPCRPVYRPPSVRGSVANLPHTGKNAPLQIGSPST